MGQTSALAGFSWSLASAVIGALTLIAVAWMGTILFKKEAMGMGDVKFLAAICSFLGASSITWVLPLSSLIGSVLGLVLIFWQRGAWGTRFPTGRSSASPRFSGSSAAANSRRFTGRTPATSGACRPARWSATGRFPPARRLRAKTLRFPGQRRTLAPCFPTGSPFRSWRCCWPSSRARAAFLYWREHQPKESIYDPVIVAVAQAEDVDPFLVRALVWRESRFNPLIYGLAQEHGLMQVTPAVGEEWAKANKIADFKPDDLFDPVTNLRAGTGISVTPSGAGARPTIRSPSPWPNTTRAGATRSSGSTRTIRRTISPFCSASLSPPPAATWKSSRKSGPSTGRRWPATAGTGILHEQPVGDGVALK